MHRILSAVRGNIVAWLALFVALGGTSLAASHYVISSAKQIKPSVLRTLRDHQGPPGQEGPMGPQGPTANVAALQAELKTLQAQLKTARYELARSTDDARIAFCTGLTSYQNNLAVPEWFQHAAHELEWYCNNPARWEPVGWE